MLDDATIMKEIEFPAPESLFTELPIGIRSALLIQTAQAIEKGTNPFKEGLTKLHLTLRLDFIIDSLETGRKLALPYRKASIEIDQRLGARITQAQKLENLNEMQKAIDLYEQNIKDGFIASLPYERLRIIYERQKKYQSVVRVCKRYIEVLQMVSEIWPQYPNLRQIPKYQKIIKRLGAS